MDSLYERDFAALTISPLILSNREVSHQDSFLQHGNGGTTSSLSLDMDMTDTRTTHLAMRSTALEEHTWCSSSVFRAAYCARNRESSCRQSTRCSSTLTHGPSLSSGRHSACCRWPSSS